MQDISYTDVVCVPFSKKAITRNEFPGFFEDYMVLHCLISKYKPFTFIEIGTSTGRGTNIICNAMQKRKVFSIDVPQQTDPGIIYPLREDGHPDVAGKYCKRSYQQLYGDSCHFDYSPYYPLDGWFVDAKHDYEHCLADTRNALLANPKLIIWHDMQIEGVTKAVVEAMSLRVDYQVFRVTDTRMAFAVLNK
jgi:hypothetical protein